MGSVPGTDAVLGTRGERLGILTTTLIRSPVTRWILHAQIRHRSLNDMVLVGDDFLHVKQVGRDGHLQHVASKTNFDSRIRAAKVFSLEDEISEEGLFLKDEMDIKSPPPQLVTLTLSCNDLMFLYLATDDLGAPRFVHQSWPLPTFDRVLFQPGEHLAVDPRSRALAVAANEREVVIYSAKTKDRLIGEISTGNKDWCPVSTERPLQVEGVIQHMDFLIPPAGDDAHIILLLIVLDHRITKAVWIDWYFNTDLRQVHFHPGMPLDAASSVSNLLIPLSNASFLIPSGDRIIKVNDILTGFPSVIPLKPLKRPAVHPGTSPRHPIWVSWCRPRRTISGRREKDHLYLAREDGLVFWVLCKEDNTFQYCFAGNLACHVGTAFASVGEFQDPDILAVAGDTSSGRVVSIGLWPTSGRISDTSRTDAMEMDLVETVPNWASMTDVVVTDLPQSHGRASRTRDGVFVTSGRQPYGAITELRQGMEARLSFYFHLDALPSVTGVWALPVAASGSLLLLLSRPTGTQILMVPQCDFDLIQEIGPNDDLSLDMDNHTLAAGVNMDGQIIQITDRSICITTGAASNFEDSAKRGCEPGDLILAAAIEAAGTLFVTMERRHGQSVIYSFGLEETQSGTKSSVGDFQQGEPFKIDHEPLAVAVARHEDSAFIALATSEGKLDFFTIGRDWSIRASGEIAIPHSEGATSQCDSIAVLRASTAGRFLALCGLRDGRIFYVAIEVAHSQTISIGSGRESRIGSTTVKLMQLDKDGKGAVGLCGNDACNLSWAGNEDGTVEINRIWVTDKVRPELAQPTIVACNVMPPADLLATDDLSDAIILVGGDAFMVASLDSTVAMVPRQIPVTGTPNRVHYAEQQRCLVAASLCAEVRDGATRSELRRSVWPCIDFIPSRSSTPSFTYSLQPGERVYALLEWSFSRQADNKYYCFILVGGSYTRSSGSLRGRVTFLQPKIDSKWQISDVKPGRSENFDAPVYALALYDKMTYVACVGLHVLLQRFSPDDIRWSLVCQSPKLASPGICVTVSAPLIYVSTADDSFMILRLEGDSNADTPRLVPVGASPKAHTSLSHITIRTEHFHDGTDITLLSTKPGQLVGFKTPLPWAIAQPYSNEAPILFEAYLPRSLTRIRQGALRPLWSSELPKGLLAGDIIGATADGTLVGISVLDRSLWTRLSWLQRLCEWSDSLSPHSWHSRGHSASETRHGRDERALPIGLSKRAYDQGQEMVLHALGDPLADTHVDGDVLARVIESGGAEKLREIIRQTAERNDRIGTWVRERLDDELGAVDEMMELLHCLLGFGL